MSKKRLENRIKFIFDFVQNDKHFNNSIKNKNHIIYEKSIVYYFCSC
jgi:hypothetical protein